MRLVSTLLPAARTIVSFMAICTKTYERPVFGQIEGIFIKNEYKIWKSHAKLSVKVLFQEIFEIVIHFVEKYLHFYQTLAFLVKVKVYSKTWIPNSKITCYSPFTGYLACDFWIWDSFFRIYLHFYQKGQCLVKMKVFFYKNVSQFRKISWNSPFTGNLAWYLQILVKMKVFFYKNVSQFRKSLETVPLPNTGLFS